MCGIYAGFDVSVYEVVQKLKKLRYRGATAAGIGFFNPNTKQPTTHKVLGKSFNFNLDKTEFGVTGPILGHCRWPSTSRNSVENTHPISSFDHRLMACHNGTVENFSDIAQKIVDDYGIHSKGQTDTEVLANWLSLGLSKYLLREVNKKAHKEWVGTWALVFLIRTSPHIYFLVKDSPLYYYNGKLSSDANLFPWYYTIPNNSYGYIENSQNNCEKYNTDWLNIPIGEGYRYQLYVNGKFIGNPITCYTKNNNFVEKEKVIEGPKMLAEIKEQATIDYKLDEHSEDFTELWNAVPHILHARSIKFFGCGSSYNAGLLGTKFFQNLRIPVSVEYSSEFDFRRLDSNCLHVAITQSGETADTKEVLCEIEQVVCNKPSTLLLTNRDNSSCWQHSDNQILLEVGLEEAVAATKSFTATVLNLYKFAECLQNGRENRYRESDIDIQFKKEAQRILENSLEIEKLCGIIGEYKNFIVLGTGYGYPIAREIALKMREVAQLHTLADTLFEQKHGNLAVSGTDVLHIIIMPTMKNDRYGRAVGTLRQIKSAGGKILGISEQMETEFDCYVPVQGNNLAQVLGANVIGQLISYYMAIKKGLDPDFPHALAKAISVY